MKRRTFLQVRAEEIAAERVAAVTMAERKCLELRAMSASARIRVDDLDLLCERIMAFALGQASGLHRDGDGREVRAAVRRGMRARTSLISKAGRTA